MLFEDEEEKEIDKGEIEKESDTFDSELYDELHLSKELNFLGNENCIMKNEIYIFQSYFMTKLISELLPKDFMKLP